MVGSEVMCDPPSTTAPSRGGHADPSTKNLTGPDFGSIGSPPRPEVMPRPYPRSWSHLRLPGPIARPRRRRALRCAAALCGSAAAAATRTPAASSACSAHGWPIRPMGRGRSTSPCPARCGSAHRCGSTAAATPSDRPRRPPCTRLSDAPSATVLVRAGRCSGGWAGGTAHPICAASSSTSQVRVTPVAPGHLVTTGHTSGERRMPSVTPPRLSRSA